MKNPGAIFVVFLLSIALLVSFGFKKREIRMVQECVTIIDVKEYQPIFLGIPHSITETRIVLSNGQEVPSDVPAWVVKATMMNSTHCFSKRIPVKS